MLLKTARKLAQNAGLEKRKHAEGAVEGGVDEAELARATDVCAAPETRFDHAIGLF
jgi:hypothetical protein